MTLIFFWKVLLMKKIICLISIILIVYSIYYFNNDNKITYLSLGDSLSLGVDSSGNVNYGYSNYLANYLKEKDLLKNYNNDFSFNGARIKDLLNAIEINKIIKKGNKSLSLKKCLREANFITLSIGMEDVLSKITFSTNSVENLKNSDIKELSKETLKDLELLFKELRKYNKKDIIFIGYYNLFNSNDIKIERLYSYLIAKTKSLTKKYQIKYLDIYSLFKKNKDYLKNPTNFYPSSIAYENIAIEIIEKYC